MSVLWDEIEPVSTEELEEMTKVLAGFSSFQALPPHKKCFTLAYFREGMNASKAARSIGKTKASCKTFGWAYVNKDDGIKAAIAEFIAAYAMTPLEVIARVSQEAREAHSSKDRLAALGILARYHKLLGESPQVLLTGNLGDFEDIATELRKKHYGID